MSFLKYRAKSINEIKTCLTTLQFKTCGWESLFKKFIRNNLGRNTCNITKISEYEGTTIRKIQIEKWAKDLNSNFQKKLSI